MSDMDFRSFLNLISQPLESSFSGEEWQDPQFCQHFSRSHREGFYNLDEEVSFLLQWLDSGPILDLGSGDSRVLRPLLQKFKGLGVDYSFSALKNNPESVIVGDCRALPLKGNFRMALLSMGQICFFKKPELVSILSQIHGLLSRGGKVYLDLPTLDAAQSFHDCNEWEESENGFSFWTRAFVPEDSILIQREVSLSREGKLNYAYSFANQIYSLHELLEIFRDLGYQVTYGAEDFINTPIKEESPWMIFILTRN